MKADLEADFESFVGRPGTACTAPPRPSRGTVRTPRTPSTPRSRPPTPAGSGSRQAPGGLRPPDDRQRDPGLGTASERARGDPRATCRCVARDPRPGRTPTPSGPPCASCPSGQRAVIVLRYYERLSEAEVADTLRHPPRGRPGADHRRAVRPAPADHAGPSAGPRMTIDLIVRETLERKLADIPVPRADLDRIRRAGRGRRRRPGARRAGGRGRPGRRRHGRRGARPAPSPSRPPPPPTVPAMDFSAGLRGLFDATPGTDHARAARPSTSGTCRTSATAPLPRRTAWSSSARTSRPGCSRPTVACARSPRPRSGPPPTSRRRSATTRRAAGAWLTRGDGRGDAVGLRARGPAPADRLLRRAVRGETARRWRSPGFDQGMVFVRGANGTRAFDPPTGQRATWLQVTDGRWPTSATG